MTWHNEKYRHSASRKGIKTSARGYGDEKTVIGKMMTEHEMLYETISLDKFRNILSNPDIEVLSYSVDYNNYGEFLFIRVRHKDDPAHDFTFFGLGFHDCRNRFIDTFSWYRGYTDPKIPETPKRKSDAFEFFKRSIAGPLNTACVAATITSRAPSSKSASTALVIVPAVSIMSSITTQVRP